MCTGSSRGFIVVGVDDEPESINAAIYAIDQARALGLCVRLVHAFGSLIGYGQYAALKIGRLERAAHALVDRVSARLDMPEGVCLERTIDSGSPVDALVDACDEARFVVIGRREKHRAPRLVRGHLASRLSARAPDPVITVPAAWRQPEHADERVVIGLDAMTPSRRPLTFAFTQAEAMGAGLTVLHAFAHEGERASTDHGASAVSEALAPLRARFPDVAVEVGLVRDRADEMLIAASADASLLVVGKPYEYAGFGAWLGSSSATVLRHADCPVAVVPQACADAPVQSSKPETRHRSPQVQGVE